ncbi:MULTISPECIES: MerR family transcriptional regulator [Streptomyces]|uniref:MerR family transcriptional regulator n=1 Tax=Streptomyces doudnae TaxID=3075536 RepID=A0ABD5EMY4_9ACTN|nr:MULTISPECIES: MerR family transcriptional regulator [unclassified Streptomyces]MDT0435988.1 MerR family transcriptional regulator [Streptomyces sp. DSM 41981]MYQ64563.1 MerR family transcriptional regulator [Streptomyces sp. SID4950]SCD81560.1 DNA-binding transcriptional regulator, MerR family [Streptomyces sp. SolWspMP-5a-2]
MRIGEVADKAGVSVRALRYYEEQDLLPADRSPGGQRHYPDSAVDRVRLIQLLYAAGLPSRVVRQVLPCVDSGRAAPTLLGQLEEERARIDGRITDLLAVRDRLDDVIALTIDPDPDRCVY